MNAPLPRRSSSPGWHNLRSSWRLLRWPLAMVAVPLALWACTDHPLEQIKPAPEEQTDLVYEANPIRKLDLIFMVDNSTSMREEQDNLRQNFPDFMNELTSIPGGAPDMHIAVISSNVGAGPTMVNSACPVGGDRGKFQVRPSCNFMGGSFLKVNGASPNITVAQLPNMFSCLAELGNSGCGYEHQLLSLYFALNGSNPENAGFLRDDAYLGIVLLSDEDDGSGEPSEADFYEGIPAGQTGSLRCSLRGHECNGQLVPAMPFMAPLTSCKPYARTPAQKKSHLIEVPFFIDFVKGLKRGRSDKILVSSVIGWDPRPNAQYKLGPNMANDLDTLPICETERTGSAAPGVRLNAFTKAFENNTVHTICQSDLKAAMTEIGKKLASILQNTCITQPLVDTNTTMDGVQADCQVLDRIPVNGNLSELKDTPIKACSATGGSMPCWDLMPDMQCGSGYRTLVRRQGDAVPGTLQSIKCLTCPMGSTDARCVR
ncbi:MAG TPA: hypothetical protein VGG33_04490 [Polyangia bacterium]